MGQLKTERASQGPTTKHAGLVQGGKKPGAPATVTPTQKVATPVPAIPQADGVVQEAATGTVDLSGGAQDTAAAQAPSANIWDGSQTLSDEAIDQILADPPVVRLLQAMKITADQVKSGKDALQPLVQGIRAAAKGECGQAILAFGAAAKAGSPLIEQGLLNAAPHLPGIAGKLLGDSGVVHQLVTDTTYQNALVQIFNGMRAGKAGEGDIVAGARALLDAQDTREAIVKVMAQEHPISDVLEQLGLTVDDLLAGLDALPGIFDAIKDAHAKNLSAALHDLEGAGQAAAPLLEKAAGKLAGDFFALPAVQAWLKSSGIASLGITQDMLSRSGAAVPDLIAAFKAVMAKQWPDVFANLKAAATDAPEVTQAIEQKILDAVKAKLPDNPPTFATVKKLLADHPFVTALLAGGAGFAAFEAFTRGNAKQGIETLMKNPALWSAAAKFMDTNPVVQEKLKELGIPPTNLEQVVDAAPHILAAKDAAKAKDWAGALDQLSQVTTAAPDVLMEILSAMPADVQSALSSVGIDPPTLIQYTKEALPALPVLAKAAQLIAKRQFKDALPLLGQAVLVAPDLVSKAIDAMLGKLEAEPALANDARLRLVLSILGDATVTQDLVTNATLRTAASLLLKGDFRGGFKALESSGSVLVDLLGAIMDKDASIKNAFSMVGIEQASDLNQLKDALPDAMQVITDVHEGKSGQAMKDLGATFRAIPEAMQEKALSSLAAALQLPQWAQGVITAVLPFFDDPDVSAALASAVDAAKAKEGRKFIEAFANMSKVLNDKDPDAAIGILNALSALPGGIGQLFGDPELNAKLVHTGALDDMWSAVGNMADRKMTPSLMDLGRATKELIENGSKAETVKTVKEIMTRFFLALPPDLQAVLEAEAAKLAARSGLQVAPIIGEAVAAVIDGEMLARALREKKDKATKEADIALTGAQLALDLAAVVQVVKPVVIPLHTILAAAKIGVDILPAVKDAKKFERELAGLGAN